MKKNTPSSPVFPFCIGSPSGLRLELNANGSIRRIDHGDIMINLFLGNEMEGGLANVYVRKAGGSPSLIPMLGPKSPAGYQFEDNGVFATGQSGDLRFRLRLLLAESSPAWFWHIELENTGGQTIECDLFHTQDVGLADYGAIRLNEYYVSQYVDHTPLTYAGHGCLVASRQNQSMGGRCPWLVTGSLGHAVSYATDALQFHGLATRAGKSPVAADTGLPGRRLQHEHSMVSLQDAAISLAPGAKVQRGFFALFAPDKMSATTPDDAEMVAAVLALPEATRPVWPKDHVGAIPSASLFVTSKLLESEALTDGEIANLFGPVRRHEESKDGKTLSFFTATGSHVVLRAKEENVLRPHGHLLRTGGSLMPDESALTSTAWMNGVFHSMVTQGHVSINRFLSTCHTYLGLFRSHGQRIFMEINNQWQLLDIPSAFEMRADSCRWIYRHRDGLVEVVATAPEDDHLLGVSVLVRRGPATRFLFSHHVALNGDDGSNAHPIQWEPRGNGIFIKAIPDSDVGRRFPGGGFWQHPLRGGTLGEIHGDDVLFSDGVSRHQPFLCNLFPTAIRAGLFIRGGLTECYYICPRGFWDAVGASLHIEAPESSPLAGEAGRVAEIFPWFVHNALVHYLSPRGLEQYSGGGWGTRDVCQGPVELLQALGRFGAIRDLLCRVFSQQNPEGDWPQWFMFFERERNIRPGDSHGDIVYWPLLALAQYLVTTGDSSLLDEFLPFFHPDGEGAAEFGTLGHHAWRALNLSERRVIRGTHLAAYGHGDWNDSLQPAKPDMRDNLCSAWTVTLNHQTLTTLAEAYRKIGDDEGAEAMESKAAKILEEFQKVLVVDGVIAGLAYFHADGETEYLLHPREKTTGLSYSVLPMIHAIINDMLTPEQAKQHLAIIREHLLGPDGARLFDRPMAYHGGPQKFFQRAESASFFGREIGIMYTHAHLRYCEALARFGDAPAFFHALCQIIPIGIRDLVPTASLRQANCYFSSSDAAFADRYDAYENYDKVNSGEVALEGGWRVYSSGAGIATRLIMHCFLGLRVERKELVIDPVVPPDLDCLTAEVELAGRKFRVTYHVATQGRGPILIQSNGRDLPFTREPNPYRTGAARVAMADLPEHAPNEVDELGIWVE